MRHDEFKVGEEIEVIDERYSRSPMHGKIKELDCSIMGGDFAKIVVASPALPAPEIWVNLRLARKTPQ